MPALDHKQDSFATSLAKGIAQVESLLSGGASVNTSDNSRCTLLMAACIQGNVEIVTRLLSHNATTEYYTSADLIEKNIVSTDATDMNGYTALEYAKRSVKNSKDIIVLLDNFSLKQLFLAIANNQSEAVPQLMQRCNTIINRMQRNGGTFLSNIILLYSSRRSFPPEFTFTEEQMNELSAKFMAHKESMKNMIRLMLDNGLNANLENHDGTNSLCTAVALSSDTELTDMLIDSNTNLNGYYGGKTLLMFACEANNKPQALHLIAMGAKVMHANKNGIFYPISPEWLPDAFYILKNASKSSKSAESDMFNLLFIIITDNISAHRTEELRILILGNINIPYQLNGKTLLMLACQHNEQNMAITLLKHGADPRLSDYEGKTAFDLSTQAMQNALTSINDGSINQEITVWLNNQIQLRTKMLYEMEKQKQKNREVIVRQLKNEIKENNHEEIKSLLERHKELLKYELNELFRNACYYGDIETVQLFLQYPVNVNDTEFRGIYDIRLMPLSIAFQKDDMALFRLLLDNGADVTIYGIDPFGAKNMLSITLPIWLDKVNQKAPRSDEEEKQLDYFMNLFEIPDYDRTKKLAIQVFLSITHDKNKWVYSEVNKAIPSNRTINDQDIKYVFQWIIDASGISPEQMYRMICSNNCQEEYMRLFFSAISWSKNSGIITKLVSYFYNNKDTQFIDDFIQDTVGAKYSKLFDTPELIKWLIDNSSEKSHKKLLSLYHSYGSHKNKLLDLLIDSGTFLNQAWLVNKLHKINQVRENKLAHYRDKIDKIKSQIKQYVISTAGDNSIRDYKDTDDIFDYFLEIGVNLNLKDEDKISLGITMLDKIIAQYIKNIADIPRSEQFESHIKHGMSEKEAIEEITEKLKKTLDTKLTIIPNNNQQANQQYGFILNKESKNIKFKDDLALLLSDPTNDNYQKNEFGLSTLSAAAYITNDAGMIDAKPVIDALQVIDEETIKKINLKEKNGTTLLMHAVLANNWKLVGHLLEKKANLFSFNTATSIDFVNRFLKRYRTSYLLTSERILPLAFAADDQELLTKSYEEILKQIADDQELLKISYEQQKEALTKILSQADETGMTLLMYACYLPDRKYFIELIQQLKNNNQLEQAMASIDNQGFSVLSHAVSAERWDIILLLIANGANLFSCKYLTQRYEKARLDEASELVPQFPNALDNITDIMIGQHDLYMRKIFELSESVYEEDTPLLEGLLKTEPKYVNIKNNSNQTPFVVACLNENQDKAGLLLTNGANPLIGWTYNTLNLTWVPDCLVDYQKHAQYLFEIVKAITDDKDNNDNYEAIAPHAAAINLLYPLLDNHHECSLLMHACRHKNTSLISKLIDCGADINGVNTMGQTALMQACMAGQYHIASLLLQLGANINIATSPDNETALMFACQNNHIDCVKLLLDHGANRAIVTNVTEQNAFDFAVNKKNHTVATLLKVCDVSESIMSSALKRDTINIVDDRSDIVDDLRQIVDELSQTVGNPSQQALLNNSFFSSPSSSSSSSSSSSPAPAPASAPASASALAPAPAPASSSDLKKSSSKCSIM